MINKDEVKDLNVGSRVAEQEVEGLKNYFLKTDLWEQILDNEVDVIFGCKGSGKSAIYNYMPNYELDLIDKNIHLLLAENPRGAIAFKDLNVTPPTNEFEFKSIWKLYFVILISQKLSEENYSHPDFDIVLEKLQDSDLIQRRSSFTSIVKMVRDYIRRINPTFEPNIGLDQYTGNVNKVGVKISLLEPSTKESDKGIVSIDNLFELLNNTLVNKKSKIWLAIDRLDAIFQENFELEANALRTLFQVYIELQQYESIRLMIFLRDDIWNKIIENGFRETSHITKTATISWDKNSLFNLIMSRFEQNEYLLENLKPDLSKEERFIELFKIIFPKKIAEGAEFNFEWFITKIKDGQNNSSPRELIQLISSAIKYEIKLLSEEKSNGDSIICMESLFEGLKDASKTKLETIIAEYPKLKIFIYRTKGKKPRLKLEELKELWNISKKETLIIINNLIKIGFFKDESKNQSNIEVLIPIIFRPALGMQYGYDK
ncbi:hypothetical protein QWY90_03065 [Flavobacterium paronense]|uniref:P-loop ATPase, Sll1717 family n=1 Tax=Flavobacterium paronense TaxID=1392775 RepID=A0ABV5GCN0_9FLAO|nr:hypothetical protein [Flavobacterium paronense]MDN3676287.1 hypothetical protein [Flavobacterium paronense]